MHILNRRVEGAFSLWRDKRQELQDTSRALEAALEAFSCGEADEPTELKERLGELRMECDELFSNVLEAVKEAQLAGVR